MSEVADERTVASLTDMCFYRYKGPTCRLQWNDPAPCDLCPNWRTLNEGLKERLRVKDTEMFATWFDLPRPMKAATGLQRTFEVKSERPRVMQTEADQSEVTQSEVDQTESGQSELDRPKAIQSESAPPPQKKRSLLDFG